VSGRPESWPLNRSAPLNDANQHNDNREYQQNVDEAAECVRADESEQPHDQKDYRNSPEQFRLLIFLVRDVFIPDPVAATNYLQEDVGTLRTFRISSHPVNVVRY